MPSPLPGGETAFRSRGDVKASTNSLSAPDTTTPSPPSMQTLQFITAIPLDVTRGSGCFIGIDTLARGIRGLGGEVQFVTPRVHLPIFTAKRILFNEQLRGRSFNGDAIVGFDLDGYSLPRKRHVAAIKGVLADAVRFESGPTRASLVCVLLASA